MVYKMSLKLFVALLFVLSNTLYAAQDQLSASTNKDNTALTQQVMKGMVLVEGGVFTMGTNDTQAGNREKPAHQVTLDSFYIGKTELTQALFQQVTGWNMSYYPCAECPVNNVSWMNIQQFLIKLNKLTGKTFRLPTEAEWAYAAKGGNQSKGYQYSGSNSIENVAWYAENAERKSHPVAQKAPNELGLYDMTGNLWEFCHDDMSRKIYTASPRVNPVLDLGKPITSISLKVLRGGGYEFSANESEVYRRDGATSNVRMPDIGFRLAMDEQ